MSNRLPCRPALGPDEGLGTKYLSIKPPSKAKNHEINRKGVAKQAVRSETLYVAVLNFERHILSETKGAARTISPAPTGRYEEAGDNADGCLAHVRL